MKSEESVHVVAFVPEMDCCVVRSGRSGRHYVVTHDGCTCAAGSNGRRNCSHVEAAVRHLAAMRAAIETLNAEVVK